MVMAVAGGALLLDENTAQANPSAFGIRGGLTDDVDTFFFGGHFAIHPRSAMRLRIEPSLELGFGDNNSDLFLFRGNVNFKIMFPVSSNAAVYPLLGPSLGYYSWDDCDACDDTEFGLNLGGGFAISGFGFDLYAGLGGIPDITFVFSYTFW